MGSGVKRVWYREQRMGSGVKVCIENREWGAVQRGCGIENREWGAV